MFRRLKFLTAESDTTVSSSAQFLEKLKGDLAIETIELLLQSKYDETENRLGRAQGLQLLKFCLRTYFTFDGTVYEQVKGTPMGSPISGFIAEAVLQRLESLVFQHHKPKFWARYVDDTFVVIDRDQLLTFKERLNAIFPDIQFTMEEKENNQLAFLHVLVCRMSGSCASANNYRPVSLTSICCKIMENIIKKALVQLLEQHHLLSDAQHGFQSGRSCLTNLLFTLERWTKARDEGNVVHAIYIDSKKAFDSVPHQRLLNKLRNTGIRGRLLVWIQSFLAGRSQRVQFGRPQSSDVSVVSGVPQGSVLAVYGPPTKGTAPLLGVDGSTLLTEKTQIIQRWAEHFRGFLNRPSAISDAAIARLPQVETNADLNLPPSLQETIRAVQQLSSGKAPRSDAIPAEVYKHGGPQLMGHLNALLQEMWRPPSGCCERVCALCCLHVRQPIRVGTVLIGFEHSRETQVEVVDVVRPRAAVPDIPPHEPCCPLPPASPTLSTPMPSSALPSSPSSYTSSPAYSSSCPIAPTTAALVADTHTSITHIYDTTTDTIPPISDSRGEDQDFTCPHCDRTFTSHIDLVSHLRTHRTETGEPVPGAPTYTHRTRPRCPRTFTHRTGLFGHMRIHESGIDRPPD
nr:unnamed protein product [Spirometra erinaceieuropaei]